MTMAKYKKGDWVRVVDNAGAPRYYEVGEICKVTHVSLSGLVSCAGKDGNMYEYRFEPWQPKVGERVRFIRDNLDGEAEYGKAGDIVVVATEVENSRLHGPRIEFTWSRHDWKPWAPLSCIEPVTDTLPVAEPLRIQTGKFYKTHDGRKVGPMFSYSSSKGWWAIAYGDANIWLADGKHKPDCTQGSYMSEAGDLIAEWVDTPVTQPVRDITAATVDAINDEYGPVVREVPVAAQQARFKVGDRVVAKTVPEAGVGIITADLGSGEYRVDYKDTWYRVCTESEKSIALVATPTAAIVCKIDNGQPLPATRPAVHTTVEAADEEAKRLANLHTGQEFGVYALTGTTQKVAKVYEHEWQRLAAEGEKAKAINELRKLAGLTIRGAIDAIDAYVDYQRAA
jgi:hypothetical protein